MIVNSAARQIVIEGAVRIEELLNNILSAELLIKDCDNSLSLGTGSANLNFNARVNLYEDLGYLKEKKNERKELLCFASIRNKFAHIHQVDTFTKCMELYKDGNSVLKKFLKDDEEFNESSYGRCFLDLYSSILNTLEVILEESSRKRYNKQTKDNLITFLKNLNQENKLDKEIFPIDFIEALNHTTTDKELEEFNNFFSVKS